MPVIDPDGLFEGQRISALSDTAKLYWPWLYAAANGYGRLELDPPAIIKRCFGSFDRKMTQDQLIIILTEYRDNFLILVYEHEGQTWIQFDTSAKYLRRHK